LWPKQTASHKLHIAVETKDALEEDTVQATHSRLRPERRKINYSNIKSQVPQNYYYRLQNNHTTTYG